MSCMDCLSKKSLFKKNRIIQQKLITKKPKATKLKNLLYTTKEFNLIINYSTEILLINKCNSIIEITNEDFCCTTCGEIKPKTEAFNSGTKTLIKLKSQCKDCHRFDRMCRYYQNPEKAKNHYKTTPQRKLMHALRSRINNILKTKIKKGSAIKDLGCSVEELKVYLESKFQSGMTWENHSKTGWHIDHIRPLSSFDLTKRKQFKEACHYTNLQPLWAIDNLKKNNKY